MFDILNTPFTLWLLSTVVIGSITFLYKKFSVRIDENQAQKDLVEKINAEISWRLYNARAFISSHDMNDSREFHDALGHLTSNRGGALIRTLRGHNFGQAYIHPVPDGRRHAPTRITSYARPASSPQKRTTRSPFISC
jgi:hypothetical protein